MVEKETQQGNYKSPKAIGTLKTLKTTVYHRASKSDVSGERGVMVEGSKHSRGASVARSFL